MYDLACFAPHQVAVEAMNKRRGIQKKFERKPTISTGWFNIAEHKAQREIKEVDNLLRADSKITYQQN
jgi:hypothetical protein